MKKIIVIFILAILAFQWKAVLNSNALIETYSAEHNGKVILYATSWCGYCKKVRKLLNDNQIDFFEYNIEESKEGREQHKNLGGRGVPVLLINGQVIQGYNPSLILELVKE